ncbi:MAG: hypothetical protein OXG35_17890 [Acidobacteria bacterium]|nr:hypothetical protein [Acidobacteriota bacterium]
MLDTNTRLRPSRPLSGTLAAVAIVSLAFGCDVPRPASGRGEPVRPLDLPPEARAALDARTAQGAAAPEPARSAAPEPAEPVVQVSDVTFDDLNEKFGVQSDWTDLRKDREWPAYEGLCVEWTGELTSLSEGLFGGFSIQFRHLATTFVSDVLVNAPSSAEEELLTWREGNRYRYRGRLVDYGGAILPITVDLGCE